MLRGGQVYYLYNDVENIQKAADRLAELVPEARIAIGHGQMRERELERVMNDFHHQRFNVLVCTTIIETGIDIPTATPSSLSVRITLAWRSFTSCAAASGVRTIRPTPGC